MAYSKNRRLAEIVSDTSGNLSVEGLTVPTQSASDSDTSAASTAFVTNAVDGLVDSAPGTLNTLNEIAAALNDDANFNTTVTNSIAAKLPLAGGTMTGNISHASDFTLDVGGDLNLDADGGDVNLKDGGTAMGRLGLENGDLNIASTQQDYDIRLKGNDGGSVITALHLDMSQAGRATFNEGIVCKSSTGGDFGVNINTLSGDSLKLQVVDTGSGGAANGVITVSDGDLILSPSANVGIGTTSPTAILDVRRGDASGKIAEFHNNSGFGIDIGTDSDSVGYISSGYTQAFAFKTDAGSGQVERMRIDSAGDINLVKAGTAQANLNFTTDGSLDYARMTGGKSGSGVGDLRFFTYSGGIAERMRIGSSGQIGIGGANYGTDGQILTSTGASTAPAWEDAPASGPSKGLALAFSLIF